MFSDLTAQAPVRRGSNYLGRAIAIESREQLTNLQLQQYIDSIRASVGVSNVAFDSFFLPLIGDFTNYVQLLPSVPEAPLGSLLLEALVRVDYVMKRWTQGRRSKDVMLLYAGFSASLLIDIDKIFQSYQVNLLDKKGDLVGHWNPFTGPMNHEAQFYSLLPHYRDPFNFKASIAHVLAKQLIGSTIYETLADDRALYYEWLGLLSRLSGVDGVFAQLFGLYKDPELIETIKAALEEAFFEPTFLDNDGNDYALTFLNWLRDEIGEGKLIVNEQDSGIHLVEQGVFIDSGLMVRYLRESALGCGFLQLYYQFMGLMGISRSEINGEQFAEVFSENPSENINFKKGAWLSGRRKHIGAVKEGIIVKNATVISHLIELGGRSLYIKSEANHRSTLVTGVSSLKSKDTTVTVK